jgi:hypothetical protein
LEKNKGGSSSHEHPHTPLTILFSRYPEISTRHTSIEKKAMSKFVEKQM